MPQKHTFDYFCYMCDVQPDYYFNNILAEVFDLSKTQISLEEVGVSLSTPYPPREWKNICLVFLEIQTKYEMGLIAGLANIKRELYGISTNSLDKPDKTRVSVLVYLAKEWLKMGSTGTLDLDLDEDAQKKLAAVALDIRLK